MGILKSPVLWIALCLPAAYVVARGAMHGLRQDPRFVAGARPVAVGLPAWADPEISDDVHARLRRLGPISLLHPEFEARVRGALEGSPVIQHVRGVSRLWPDRYSVEIVFHRPAVVLERDGRRYPMTWDGVRLPADAYHGASRRLFPIRGVSAKLPAPGERIRSRAFDEGIATLQQLAPHLPQLADLGIVAVDVSSVEQARLGVLLLTRSGVPVRWGRPLAAVGENDVETKVQFLLAAQEELDTLSGYVIDARYDQPYVRESSAP